MGICLMSYEFNIPSTVPSGKYLVRIEHIGVHNAANYGGAQFFVACGQIEVIGGGSGSPGPLVAIPGEYKADHPGIYFNNYFPAVGPHTYKQTVSRGRFANKHPSRPPTPFPVHQFGPARERTSIPFSASSTDKCTIASLRAIRQYV
ncbi:unnamed protein product [Clonostachys chloroleuca]|uniref:lytic cellulose monooxygenase (C4-dehydrogenating) n=1 Tax=Clonostachys chloroleuca TaxID=1926264 RepID=A0AA35LVX1_9HYPO|nr:unnamed protein product [Clonostachys chloroleuca]